MLQPRIPRLLTSRLLNPNPSFLFFLPHRSSPAPQSLLPFPSHQQQQIRPASHASQGVASKAAPGPGKRLGAKKSDSEYVVPGNIIFRQRGTHWFPGENCGMGRDHTIFALEKGYVRYYKDENWGVRKGHGKKRNRKEGGRKFIGVVLERGMKLPRPKGMARVRRVGLDAVPVRMATGMAPSTLENPNQSTDKGSDLKIAIATDVPVTGLEGKGEQRLAKLPVVKGNAVNPSDMPLKAGYMYRKSNWEIGREAERAGVKVREYRRGDRWLAWRKRVARREAVRERKSVGRGKKGK